MKKYIAFIRGINVCGQKKVPMVELRGLFQHLNFNNVQTYIQSGNVIFQSIEINKTVLENSIQKAMLSHFGFDVSVLVRTSVDIKTIMDSCPFSDEKKLNSHFTLLHTTPNEKLKDETSLINYPNEEFLITDRCVYFFSSSGYGNAKCNNNFFECKLKVSATTRNYNTMIKLLSLCAEN